MSRAMRIMNAVMGSSVVAAFIVLGASGVKFR